MVVRARIPFRTLVRPAPPPRLSRPRWHPCSRRRLGSHIVFWYDARPYMRVLLISDPFQQRQAHEQPVIFYSVVLGIIGPVMVLVVPPIRKSMGYKPSERPPTTYPRMYPPL